MYRRRTIAEEYTTDLIFQLSLLILSFVVSDSVSWLPPAIHVTVSVAVLPVITSAGSDAAKGFISTSGAALCLLSDVVVVFQLWSKFDTPTEVEVNNNDSTFTPVGFTVGINSISAFNFAASFSAHAMSAGGSAYRLHRSSGEYPSSCYVAVTLASCIFYAVWLTDAFQNLKFYSHLMVVLAFLAAAILETVLTFIHGGAVILNSPGVWWFTMCVMGLEYIILVSNASSLHSNKSITEGGAIVPTLTQPFQTTNAKVQGVIISLAIVLANGIKCVQTHSVSPVQKEPFLLLAVSGCFYFLPGLSTTVAVFSVSRGGDSLLFTLLLYSTFLQLRFWTCMRASNAVLIIIVSSFGVIADVSLCVSVLLWNATDGLTALDDYMLLSVALTSGFVSSWCIVYIASQVLAR